MGSVFVHHPVMLKEAVAALKLKKGDVVLDGTLGGGGHALEILKRITPGGFLIALDADSEAVGIAEKALQNYKGSFKVINDNFRNLDKALSGEGVKGINSALFDIGLSSYQIESESRGFGIKNDARLDMRMDRSLGITAYDIVNSFSEEDISGIIEKYGEDYRHKRIARRIVEARSENPVTTTHELAAVVRKAIGFKGRRGRIDPATKTFQALRIAVNDELAALEEGIRGAVPWLEPSGRICIISFHSLEDRIVKNLFKGYSALGILKIITKKPLQPLAEEVMRNARSRSARLRAAERI